MTTVYKTPESQRRASKKYTDAHSEEKKAQMKIYYQENKEIIKKRRMERYYAHKAKKDLEKLTKLLSKEIVV